jgi:3-phenylpropionate/trans-cinnamate dioxygenase ferredoxin reductase component
MNAERIVVAGGGLAAGKAVEALRARGFSGSLTLIGAEDELPYERPPLSKEYLQGKKDAASTRVHPQEWYREHDVELRLGTEVTAVDRDAQEVVLASGERLGYDQLLLATGSIARRLPLPGSDLDGVLTLRNIADSDRLREAFKPDARVVLIGGGWIGLETAAAARLAGAEVAVLERDKLPLSAVLGPEVAQVFADLHRAHGVDLRTEVGVSEIAGAEGHVTGVRLADGTELPADVVLVGVGAAPVVRLAEEAGLDVDNGVLVDAQLRTSDPRIFAAGDIANAVHPVLGGRIRVEHWANALNQPDVAAAAMLGGDEVYDRLPYFFTDQYDLGMEYTGHVGPAGYDRVVLRGDVPGREFIAFWMRDGAVVAGMNVNVWDVTDDIQRIIAAGPSVDADRLGDADVPLADLVG